MKLPILKLALKSTKLTNLLKKNIKPLLFFGFSRKILNRSYQILSFDDRKRFHSKFAKMYRQDKSFAFNGNWKIRFIDTEIYAPIIKSDMWLSWDSAVSILGHDIEIKMFYETLLRSNDKPKVFFDVGANYGTHSLLWQSQGVETYSFEPNPNCYTYFEQLFKINTLIPNIIQKAIGESPSAAVLSFPEKETWNGTIDQDVKDHISLENDLVNITVEITTLDSFSEEFDVIPDIIKIDTEGFEINVLAGATHILKEKRPIIVFESHTENKKSEIFVKLSSFEYSIYDFKDLNKPLDLDTFKKTKKTNFIACHKSKILPYNS